jgi:hypothetical protein
MGKSKDNVCAYLWLVVWIVAIVFLLIFFFTQVSTICLLIILSFFISTILICVSFGWKLDRKNMLLYLLILSMVLVAATTTAVKANHGRSYNERGYMRSPILSRNSKIKSLPGFGGTSIPNAQRANMTFLVLSTRTHALQRAAVRDSWALEQKNVVFIVGARPCKIPPSYRSKHVTHVHHCEPGLEKAPKNIYDKYQQKIQAEQDALEHEARVFSDLILVPMMDTYGGLPRKVKEALSWGLKNTNSEWFMKVDDDVAVRAKRIEQALSMFDPSHDMIIGRVRKNAGIPRGGKWADHEYKSHQKYPTFCNGGEGWIVPRHLARMIVDHDGFEYQGEDISMGIWVDEIQDEFSIWVLKQHNEYLLKLVDNWYKQEQSKKLIQFVENWEEKRQKVGKLVEFAQNYKNDTALISKRDAVLSILKEAK